MWFFNFFYYIFHPPSETRSGWGWLKMCTLYGMRFTSPLEISQTVTASAASNLYVKEPIIIIIMMPFISLSAYDAVA